MLRRLFAVAASSLAFAQIAYAADIPLKAPPPPPAPLWSWTGFYVGGDVGEKWMHDKWTDTSLFDGSGPLPGFNSLPIDPSSPRIYDTWGVRAGGYVGYNW